MTSWPGNPFHITALLTGLSTGHKGPVKWSFDVSSLLSVLAIEQTVEMPVMRDIMVTKWRQCNESKKLI